MWPHFVNLLAQTWADLLLALGTTTLAIVLFSVFVPVAIWFSTVISKWLSRRGSQPPMTFGHAFSESASSAIVTGSITLGVWLVIFGCFAIRTVYRDHQGLVNTVKQDKGTISRLQNQPKPVCPAGKPCICPSCPPKPEQAKQCWPDFTFGISVPSDLPKEADANGTAVMVMVHCNYKIEAPFIFQVDFDNDFTPGAFTLSASVGMMMERAHGKSGNSYTAIVNAPALLPGQLALLTVYGKGSNRVKPVRATIHSL